MKVLQKQNNGIIISLGSVESSELKDYAASVLFPF